MTRSMLVLLLALMIEEPEKVTDLQMRRVATFIRDNMHKINW